MDKCAMVTLSYFFLLMSTKRLRISEKNCKFSPGWVLTGGMAMKNGQLELPIDGCTEDRLFSIRAKDRLGNRSDSLTLSNPYYKEPEEEDTEKDTKQEHDEHCPEDCDCRKEQTAAQPSTPGTTTGSAPVSTTSAPVTTLSGGSTGTSM